MTDSVAELREARGQITAHIQQLEIQVNALTTELESVHSYYKGMNDLLDRLSVVKGPAQKQRVAMQILDLRDRKLSLKKVATSE